MKDERARSASPQLRRSISPLGLSMAQQRAQTAEQKVESAFSSIGIVADQTCHAQAVAEVAITEARSVHDEVSSRIATFVKRANDSTSSTIGILTGRVEEAAMQTEAQTSRVAVQVTQQLERNWKPLQQARPQQ